MTIAGANFELHRPTSVDDGARLLSNPGATPMGGGTDLLVLIDEGLTNPTSIVDLRRINGFDRITELPNGDVRIGVAVSIDRLAQHAAIRSNFAALAEACDVVATPALRNMGTLGGNLCQRPRCWYYRRAIPCLKNGGDSCPAQDGENQYLAILGGGPCYIVHPSDPAVALTALEATVEIHSAGGRREIPIAELYLPPSKRIDHETSLASGEFIASIVLPARSRGGRQLYRKAMQRGAWDFALASVAGIRRDDGEVRLVLGGVAPLPWRVDHSVEEDVSSGGLDGDSIAALAARALYDARPLSNNGYKVRLAESLLADAMRMLDGD